MGQKKKENLIPWGCPSPCACMCVEVEYEEKVRLAAKVERLRDLIKEAAEALEGSNLAADSKLYYRLLDAIGHPSA